MERKQVSVLLEFIPNLFISRGNMNKIIEKVENFLRKYIFWILCFVMMIIVFRTP